MFNMAAAGFGGNALDKAAYLVQRMQEGAIVATGDGPGIVILGGNGTTIEPLSAETTVPAADSGSGAGQSGVAVTWVGPVNQMQPLAASPSAMIADASAGKDLTDFLHAAEHSASTANDIIVVAEKSALFAAKYDAQTILERAAPLTRDYQVGVAVAEDLGDAAKVFRSPSGQAAQSLAEAAGKYGTMFKGLGYAGVAATAIEESAYIAGTPEDRRLMAVGASVTNVAGDTVSIVGGAEAGALIGAYFAPFTAGLSIPIFALAGGIGGHFAYDWGMKDFVREGWTGIQKPKE
jgi:hypothetical protein